MAILVAIPDSIEGTHALAAAAREAQLRRTNLIAMNLTLGDLDTSSVSGGVDITVLERTPTKAPEDCVLDAIATHPEVELLVIGIKRRTPVGKALLGSISQRLLLDAEVPVLAVKAPRG